MHLFCSYSSMLYACSRQEYLGYAEPLKSVKVTATEIRRLVSSKHQCLGL